jgi:hypothetical protein
MTESAASHPELENNHLGEILILHIGKKNKPIDFLTSKLNQSDLYYLQANAFEIAGNGTREERTKNLSDLCKSYGMIFVVVHPDISSDYDTQTALIYALDDADSYMPEGIPRVIPVVTDTKSAEHVPCTRAKRACLTTSQKVNEALEKNRERGYGIEGFDPLIAKFKQKTR